MIARLLVLALALLLPGVAIAAPPVKLECPPPQDGDVKTRDPRAAGNLRIRE